MILDKSMDLQEERSLKWVVYGKIQDYTLFKQH